MIYRNKIQAEEAYLSKLQFIMNILCFLHNVKSRDLKGKVDAIIFLLIVTFIIIMYRCPFRLQWCKTCAYIILQYLRIGMALIQVMVHVKILINCLTKVMQSMKKRLQTFLILGMSMQ